ncbi:MAG: excinuclease ABC subunit UvrA [Candidatus Portnoybacteria bacterium]|nr:excinuclease ABC subunit UvrA [Candidatus Portnoybacteria bacterium]
MSDYIKIRGARVHNLKNISLDIPKNKLIVITGVSGSGKSSLAFDTLFSEGQRRYIESLSTYARQFLGQLDKPDVDRIDGLSPAIAISQKSLSRSPRSTVGTVTEIYDYLRLLFAKAGVMHCPSCGREVRAQAEDEIIEKILAIQEHTPILILAPVIKGKKGHHKEILEHIKAQGFIRVRVDKKIYRIEAALALDLGRYQIHTIEVVVDRLSSVKGERSRIADSLETGLKAGDGQVIISSFSRSEESGDILFSTKNACPYCEISLPELEPRSFSFNSPFGACSECAGLGKIKGEWYRGADGRWTLWEECPRCQGKRLKPEFLAVRFLGKTITDIIKSSIGDNLTFFKDIYLYPKPYSERSEEQGSAIAGSYTLNPKIVLPILKEIVSRLQFLIDVGLHYLTLSRESGTLAGGEAQRIQLATQIGSRLSGVLYILDEPSIGLHKRDHQKLLRQLKELRDLGNTVIVVEHDSQTIEKADWVIDLGPGGGERGGKITFQGTVKELKKSDTLTGKYLSGKTISYITSGSERRVRPVQEGMLIVKGAKEHNLKNIDVAFPLGKFISITGVSGSGKSSLIYDVLARALQLEINRAKVIPGEYERLEGIQHIDRAVSVDQSPIGKTPRSTVATYTKIFDEIRWLFSQTQEARARGWKPGRFSFNARAGRCERCQGQGELLVEMQFLPPVYVTCEVCKGRRYKKEVFEVEYKGKDISQVLQMTVSQALEFFSNVPYLKKRLEVLLEIGLDYIRLGQTAPTLSGGEAQRIKLAKELLSYQGRHTFYILDEPTTGLHFDDIRKLLIILRKLVDADNTVVVIEHNMDVIRSADWIIDLGPEGGEEGGYIVAQGTPEEITRVQESWTGKFLCELL